MKKLALLLSAALTSSLPFPSAMADQSPAASGPPRPGTVEAARCLVRQGPAGCEKVFQGRAWVTARSWVFANVNRDFKRGAFVSSNFWGRAADSNIYDARAMIHQPTSEMDIFDVKFAHVKYTFYISPADADGKIQALAILLYEPHDRLQLAAP
jgi:hypothetical protein